MKKMLMIASVLAVMALVFSGCTKKADENKPVAEIKAEVEKMDVGQLKSMAMGYKDAILAKQKDVEKLTAKLKDIPMTNMLGEEAKKIKADVDNVTKSLSALKERFQVYYDKLKEKGGDLSGLQL